MRNRIIFTLLALIALVVNACQDVLLENSLDNYDGTVNTRSLDEQEDFYWSEGKKVHLKRIDNKSFIMFKSSDKEALVTAMSENKIIIDESKIREYSYSGTDMSGKAAKDFLDYCWAEVDVNDSIAYSYPETVYSAPYYTGSSSYLFPLTNLIYVTLRDDGDINKLERLAEENNLGIIGKHKGVPHLYIASCTKESKGNALEMANVLHDSGFFEEVEPAFINIFPQDPVDNMFSQQWNLNHTGQHDSNYSGYDIKYLQASIPTSSNIVVAVVDNGVYSSHSDINLNSFSWNSDTNSSPSVITTYYGDYQYLTYHGTNVAGIISGKTNNTIGISGIASCASLMSLSFKYINEPLTTSNAAAAIIKAVNQGADVINCSWGGGSSSSLIEYAIQYAVTNGRNGKGCVVVFSAGNSGQNSIYYPACHTPERHVISVGAISYNGKRKTTTSPDGEGWGSNYGTNLDIVAPGVLIPTTTNGGGWVTNFNGTSAAAAHVSGAAALVLAKNPDLYYDEVGFILQKSANKSLPGYTFSSTSKAGGTWNSEVGHGLLNLYSALSMTQSVSYPNSGSVSLTGGQTTLDSGGSGYVGTTFTASPYNSSYDYYWSGSYTGTCNSWYVTPNTANSPIGNVSVYLNSGQSGVLAVTCRVYSNTSFIGSYTQYVNVSY
ncbi:MAG: S8 family serine peptidase [Bacteroidaceae bacterium]|nr:S8 family serine peptidase [Bacteroidaceae bacterium]